MTERAIQVKSIDVKGTGKGTSPHEIVARMEYLCGEKIRIISVRRARDEEVELYESN